MITEQIKIIANSTLDIFYPNNCEICSVDLHLNEQHICLSCLYDLPYIEKNEAQKNSLQQLFWGRTEIEEAFSLFNYQKGNQAQDILHLIKYKKKTKLAEFLGAKLGENIKCENPLDYIIPVPLHPKKLRKRGYNQATVIAKGVESVLKIPIRKKLIKRIKHNPSQTTITKYDRWENVKGIFEIRKASKLINKHVLLVDDVLTTGATLEACINQLLKVKGCKVSIATLAARV